MNKAIIIYRSKTGTTKSLGEKIYSFLRANGTDAEIASTDEIDNLDLLSYEFFVLGCWTSGLLLFMQKPENQWIEFAHKLPVLKKEKTILFTTYKIRTGSMFREMSKHLKFADNSKKNFEVKSRNGQLDKKNQNIINQALQAAQE